MKSKLLNFKLNKNFKFQISNFSKGFTLIELLIVIAIIGVLATILLANFIGVRQRARDAQRKADLRQIQGAIELYKADQGVYPPMPLYSTSNCPTSTSLTGGSPAITYMAKIPCDVNSVGKPSFFPGDSSGRNYYYSLNGSSTYQLVACLENTNDTGSNVVSLAFLCPTRVKAYYLTNP